MFSCKINLVHSSANSNFFFLLVMVTKKRNNVNYRENMSPPEISCLGPSKNILVSNQKYFLLLAVGNVTGPQRVMKPQYNMSSDGGLVVSLWRTTHSAQPPHIVDLVVVVALREGPSFKSGRRIILIGLLNTGVISVLLTRKLQTLPFPCATFKDVQMDYDLTVD